MSADLQQRLGRALEKVSSSYGEMALSPKTEIEALPAAFFSNYHIYELTHRAPNKPIQFYVGYAENKPVYLITGQPDNYFKIAEEDHVQLKSEAEALDYIRLYLKVTRPMNKLFYVVNNVDQIKFRPNLEAAQEAVKSAFLKHYEDAINSPAKVHFGEQYMMTVYLIHDMDFKEYTITVDKAGKLLNTEIKILQKGLPLVYSL
jgi:hypothetical protein